MFWSTFLHISFQEILLFNHSLQRWMSWVWVQLADLTKVLLMLQTDDLGENSSKNTKNITHPVFLVSPVTWYFFFSLCVGLFHSNSLSHINAQNPPPTLREFPHLVLSNYCLQHIQTPVFSSRNHMWLCPHAWISITSYDGQSLFGCLQRGGVKSAGRA